MAVGNSSYKMAVISRAFLLSVYRNLRTVLVKDDLSMECCFHRLLNPAPVDSIQTPEIRPLSDYLCLTTTHGVCTDSILVR
jgi:hypothetical protein